MAPRLAQRIFRSLFYPPNHHHKIIGGKKHDFQLGGKTGIVLTTLVHFPASISQHQPKANLAGKLLHNYGNHHFQWEKINYQLTF